MASASGRSPTRMPAARSGRTAGSVGGRRCGAGAIGGAGGGGATNPGAAPAPSGGGPGGGGGGGNRPYASGSPDHGRACLASGPNRSGGAPCAARSSRDRFRGYSRGKRVATYLFVSLVTGSNTAGAAHINYRLRDGRGGGAAHFAQGLGRLCVGPQIGQHVLEPVLVLGGARLRADDTTNIEGGRHMRLRKRPQSTV